jgi:hypothetical protein
MSDAHTLATQDPYAGDRTGTILGAAAGIGGSAAVLLFWTMGAIGLFSGNSGTILLLNLEGYWRLGFLAYPFVFVFSLIAGGALAAVKRDLEAVGVLGMPVALAVAFYIALIQFRPL